MDMEDLPTREGGIIRRMGYNAKCADGPKIEYASELRRFLCSMEHQEWNYVHSTIVKKAKDGTKWAKWALDHLEWTVQFDCTEEDGKVFDTRGNRVESWGRPEFYVTRSSIYQGLLKRAPERPKYVRPEQVMPVEGPNYYEIDGTFFEVHFKKFDGIKRQPVPGQFFRYPLGLCYDVLTKTSLTWPDCELRYGGLISWKKRQLSKREIRKLGLRCEASP